MTIKLKCVGCGKKTGLSVPSSTPGVRIALCWTCQSKLERKETQEPQL